VHLTTAKVGASKEATCPPSFFSFFFLFFEKNKKKDMNNKDKESHNRRSWVASRRLEAYLSGQGTVSARVTQSGDGQPFGVLGALL
jgi:hypothetical protein